MIDLPVELPVEFTPAPPVLRVTYRLHLSDGTTMDTTEDDGWPHLLEVLSGGCSGWLRTSAGPIVNPAHVVRVVPL